MKKRQAMYPQLWPDAKRDRAKRVTRPKRKARIIREYSGSSSMEYSADIEEAAVPVSLAKLTKNPNILQIKGSSIF